MKPAVALFLLSIVLFPVLYLVGIEILFVYVLVWIDKMLLGLFRPFRYFGIELTTLATVFATIFYGTFASFLVILILFTLIQSIRYLVIPISVPDYPLFVPNPDSIIYSLGAIAASLAMPFGFGTAVIAVVITKYVMYFLFHLMMKKPPSAITGIIGGIAFHAIVMIPFGLEMLKLLATST